LANLYLSDSTSELRDLFIGHPVKQANQAVVHYLKQSLDFAFGVVPTNTISNLMVTGTKVEYTLSADSVTPGGVKIVINGSGFPNGATTLSAISADTDYNINSVVVILGSGSSQSFTSPLSTVTLNTDIRVAASRMVAFGLNGFSVKAGDVNLSLNGKFATTFMWGTSGNIILDTANFRNAELSLSYDTDPSSTSTKLAQLFLKGDFSLQASNMSNPITSASITDFGFKIFGGTDVMARPVHYFYGDNLNIALNKLDLIPANATAEDLLRTVFDGVSDTVYTSSNIKIPEGFEKIHIQGTSGLEVTANGLGNTINGSSGSDSIYGEDGDDRIDGRAGNDALFGGAGRDILQGGAGNDILSGGIGNDQVYGGHGNDWMEHVNDSFSPDNAPGQDTYYGGRGNDVYIIDELGAVIVERRSEGTDSVYSQLDNYTLADNVENLTHDRGWGTVDFTGRGNAIANVIESAAGNDSLFGLAGDDKLIGNEGNDLLNGGAGRDELRGGLGADQFVFDAALNSGTNRDTIVDFNRIQGDKLLLEDRFFAKLRGGITADQVRVNATGIAEDSSDHLIFNSTNGKLFYDADGSGRGAAIEFVTLTGVSTLSHDDFFII
jgi:Ca2+-binding RTX toxin-like protein